MLLTIQNLQKSYGANVILSNVGAVVDKQDKIGIIGENGAGKTTLMKILTGNLAQDKGDVIFAKGTFKGYLEQNSALNPRFTVYDEMKSVFAKELAAEERLHEINALLAKPLDDEQKNALLQEHDELTAMIDAADLYTLDTQIKKVLNGMAFTGKESEKQVSVLSGGEYTRLCLAKLLLQKPDVLFLDEPTNHLDFEAMEWLENYLKSYEGAVLVISHDRYFLDNVCNRIFEVEKTALNVYKGNYTAYTQQKEHIIKNIQKQQEEDAQKAAKLEEYIAKNIVRASTTKMAQSRRKQLEKMAPSEKLYIAKNNLKFTFDFNTEPYKDVLIAKNLSVEIGGKTLCENLSIDVKRGESLVIAGPNGAGKSTLLRVLNGKLRPKAGTVMLGRDTKVSIFEQQQLRRGGTVINTIWDKHPNFTQLDVRNHLAKLNFKGEDVFKPCAELSGGELARLRFAEMLLENANVLFMDEPTNHLDIFTRESLNEALCAFEGTLIVVTHDRYLMNSLQCKILHIDGENTAIYNGYDHLMKRNLYKAAGASTAELQSGENAQQPLEQQETKQAFGKEERRRKAQLRELVKRLEQDMQMLDDDIEGLERQLNEPDTLKDHVRLNEICTELEQKRKEAEEAFEKWGEASEQLDGFE